MPRLEDLPTPALLVDLDRLEVNLSRMQERCERLGVALRPHVKTHKCLEVARLQRDLGARGITVSTLAEARAFADGGFDDLTWAFPVIPSRLPEAVELARRVTLRLTLDTPAGLAAVEAAARKTGFPLHVHLEVDCGDHRSGIDPSSPEAVALAGAMASSAHVVFDGLLTHSGHAYRARSRAEAAAVAEEERSVMAGLAERLRGQGIEVPTVSVGSTPAMAAAATLAGVTEARPGNYAYYDLTQVAIGSCQPSDCALTVLATVVSSHPDRPGGGHAAIDAGALALSKDPGPENDPEGAEASGFGRVYRGLDGTDLDPALHVTGVSQEHGLLSAPLLTGTRVRILPNHSCLTNACFDEVHAVRGQEVEAAWKVWRAR